MKKNDDWKYWRKRAENAVLEADDIPDAGSRFAESVIETLSGIAETIDETKQVTNKQRKAIKNMEKGIRKWTKQINKEDDQD